MGRTYLYYCISLHVASSVHEHAVALTLKSGTLSADDKFHMIGLVGDIGCWMPILQRCFTNYELLLV